MPRVFRFLLAGLLVVAATGCGDDASPDTPETDVADATTEDGASADAGGDAAEDGASADVAPPGDVETDTAPAPSVLDFAVDTPGPFAVGYREWETTYTVPGTGESRTIAVHAWYPASEAVGVSPSYLGLGRDTDAYTDAPVAAPVDGLGYPVHVYSHGHQGFAGTSAFLMRYFASHGWVAVAPDHEGNLLTDNRRGDLFAHYLERPSDIRATLDALEALSEDDPLSAAITDRVVLSGHSRGAYTVWANAGAAYDLDAIAADWPDASADELAAFEAGLGDDRVAASMVLAGAYRASWFGDAGWEAVSTPMLALSGTADNPEEMQAQFDRVGALNVLWVELEGGCHQSFALGGCTTLADPRAFELVDTFAMAFARRFLLDDTSAATVGILTGERSLGDEVRLELGAGAQLAP
jgi:predicted dienelactone hydrolase